jgi:hypothetical protein
MTVDNSNSQQSCAGMSDEGLGIAAIGLEHLQTPVAGDVGEFDQVGTALHCGGHEARPQAVTGKARSLEPEPGGGSLDDGRDVAGGKTSIRDPLRCCTTRIAAAPRSQSRSSSGRTTYLPASDHHNSIILRNLSGSWPKPRLDRKPVAVSDRKPRVTRMDAGRARPAPRPKRGRYSWRAALSGWPKLR